MSSKFKSNDFVLLHTSVNLSNFCNKQICFDPLNPVKIMNYKIFRRLIFTTFIEKT